MAAALPVDASIDAAPPDLRLAVVLVIPAHTEYPGGYISCHNFGPGNRGCNPPPPIRHPEARVPREIIDVEAHGRDVILAIATRHDDVLVRGMPVTAQTPAMDKRALVGHVLDVRPRRAKIRARLSREDVLAGAALEVAADPKAKPIPLPPAPPMIARIIDIGTLDAGTIVMVDVGSNDGVDRGWRVIVVDERGKPIRGGEGLVHEVTKDSAITKLKLTRDQVERAGRALVEPPRSE
jgi:hypothetical protein